MNLHHIPRHLNAPAQILWWELDEISVVLALVSLGIMIEFFLPCLIVGLVTAKAMRRMKEGHQDNIIVHFMHWHGVPGLTMHGAPPGAWRLFIE